MNAYQKINSMITARLIERIEATNQLPWKKPWILEDLPWEMGATIIGTQVWFHYDEYIQEHFPDWNYVQHALVRNSFPFESHLIDKQTGKPSTTPICEFCNDEVPCINRVYWIDDPASIVPEYTAVDHQSCRLNDGEYWYELHASNGVVQANTRWKGSSPQLKLTRLETGDFNQDGYMDVKVQRDLPGSACPTEVLILSRKTPKSQFYVVEHLGSDVRM
jgi:hypothetical protein